MSEKQHVVEVAFVEEVTVMAKATVKVDMIGRMNKSSLLVSKEVTWIEFNAIIAKKFRNVKTNCKSLEK